MTAKYATPLSSERKLALAVLIAGVVLALASLVGPAWLLRVGVVVAVLSAGLSMWIAFLEMRRLERLHRGELRAVKEVAALTAHQHHLDSMELIATFQQRTRAHNAQVGTLRGELATIQHELSTVRGNLLSARNESALRVTQLTELQAQYEAQLTAEREAYAALEAQVAALSASSEGEPTTEAELVSLPRRVVSRRALSAELPTAEELWHNGDHPTLVNEALLHLPDFGQDRRHA